MKEKTHRRKEGKSISRLRVSYEAITVGSGRDAEPYIIAFHHKSDNVAGKNLGTLFGFFEVEIHDEDAAYIVNFLASIAKKEYFTNPRRSVEDSFETTLHKVNVALAEIAKEGNVSWLGHLHGILGAVSTDSLYFSATGDGVLGLIRDDTFRPISDGLAENLTEPHPLKTFTEVSSGKLIDGDILLALSPAIWTLFTPDDLKKNVKRFNEREFEQFLRTALINELPLAGAVIVRTTTETINAAPIQKKTQNSDYEDSTETVLANVWSKQAFEKAKAARLATLEIKETLTIEEVTPHTNKQTDYIDRKTGHIYIQGEAHTTSSNDDAWKDRIDLMFGTLLRSWSIYQDQLRRAIKRWKKHTGIFLENTSQFSARLGRGGMRRARTLLRHWRAHQKNNEVNKLYEEDISPLSEELPVPQSTPAPKSFSSYFQNLLAHYSISQKIDRLTRPIHKKLSATHPHLSTLSPPSISKSTSFVQTLESKIQASYLWFTSRLVNIGRSLFLHTQSFWRARTKQERSLILGMLGIGTVFILGGIFYLNRSTLWGESNVPTTSLETPEITPEPPKSPATLEENEPLATRLSDGRALTAPFNFKPLAFVSINSLAFGVTRDRIVNVTTQESVTSPEPIRLAAAMDDLDAIFLFSESGTLYMYTIANKKFEANTLPAPEGIVPAALGSYLTYLYVLDEKTKTVYRFPRSEGGFAAPTKWSKQPLESIIPSSFTLGESVGAIGTDALPHLFERGTQIETTFTGPQNPPRLTTLTFDTISTDLFGLDPSTKRVIRWKVDGTLVAQYFHPSFETTSHILIGEKNTLLVVRPDGTFAFQLP